MSHTDTSNTGSQGSYPKQNVTIIYRNIPLLYFHLYIDDPSSFLPTWHHLYRYIVQTSMSSHLFAFSLCPHPTEIKMFNLIRNICHIREVSILITLLNNWMFKELNTIKYNRRQNRLFIKKENIYSRTTTSPNLSNILRSSPCIMVFSRLPINTVLVACGSKLSSSCILRRDRCPASKQQFT